MGGGTELVRRWYGLVSEQSRSKGGAATEGVVNRVRINISYRGKKKKRLRVFCVPVVKYPFF
jgi:hypothetical protein